MPWVPKVPHSGHPKGPCAKWGETGKEGAAPSDL